MVIYLVIGLLVVINLFVFFIISQKMSLLKERNRRLSALRKLDEVMISSYSDQREVAQKVTDAMAFELGFNNGVLALIDDHKGTLKRVAMSNTPEGIKAKQSLPMPYEQLEIPLTADQNISIQAMKSNTAKVTHDLHDLFVPVFDRTLSKKIQDTVGVTTSIVYPIRARGRVIGVMIVSIDKPEAKLLSYEKETISELFDVVGITLDNARIYQELRETTKKLEVANKRLEELDRLKDEFVSLASHELRTPLTAISSYLYMALYKNTDKLPEKTGKYLTRAYLSAQRLITLVNDMLNVSRIETNRIEITPKPFNMVEMVREISEDIAPKADEKGVKVLVLDSRAPEVFADSDKVHEVLFNLIGNSLKFTPQGGTITVSFLSDGNILETQIKDTGVGISRDELSKLFQKFGRLDSSYLAMGTTGGTGLGLYISKMLIERMQGKIWASSEGLNKGTTMTFTLPLASEETLSNAENYRIKVLGGAAKGLEPATL